MAIVSTSGEIEGKTALSTRATRRIGPKPSTKRNRAAEPSDAQASQSATRRLSPRRSATEAKKGLTTMRRKSDSATTSEISPASSPFDFSQTGKNGR